MQTLEDKEELPDELDEGIIPAPPIFEAGYRPPERVSRITPDLLARIASAVIVVTTTAFVIWQLHPMTLLFTNAMDVGGDNAGHVAAPYYLIHNLLPHFQLSGWDPNWYDGFPLYVFYFPLPPLLMALLNIAMPYAVAFKLVTVAGSVLMPGAAYFFGRMAGFRRPVPALMSAAMLPFLFNTSYTIDGGNIASTMAGEFSFSLSMVFGLAFLGVVARGLENGKHRGWAAVLYAFCLLSHVVPALFFAFAALLFLVAKGDWRRIWYLAPAGITGVLLSGFFLIPFGTYLRYTSSMGYQRVAGAFQQLFPPGYLWIEYWVAGLAVIGLMIAVHNRFIALEQKDTYAVALGGMAIAAALAFSFLPSGQVYNARWIPFWFLSVALLGAYGAGELIRLLGKLLEFERWNETVGALLVGAASLVVVAIPLNLLSFAHVKTSATNFVPDWVAWNYTGFQGKPGWNEFESIATLAEAQAKKYGCGRLDYEYTGTSTLTNSFGSSMALMSLPMWTNGCINTVEGPYFESSTTTPFHFLDESQWSAQPSQPGVGWPYPAYNVADGIRHDQLMGVRYFLAGASETENYASKDANLQYLGSIGGTQTVGSIGGHKIKSPDNVWKLYLIKNSPLITPLSYEPVVESGQSGQQWLGLGFQWYQNEQYWSVPIALGGPSSWPHAAAGTLFTSNKGVAIKPTSVSNIVTGNESISFDVTTTGVPVLVKIPYFPNWQASGAQGPWEISPNLMVVVPTSKHVVLTYGISHADIAGYAASGLGVGLLVTFAVMGPVKYERIRIRRRAKHARRHGRHGQHSRDVERETEEAGDLTEAVPAVGVDTEQIPAVVTDDHEGDHAEEAEQNEKKQSDTAVKPEAPEEDS